MGSVSWCCTDLFGKRGVVSWGPPWDFSLRPVRDNFFSHTGPFCGYHINDMGQFSPHLLLLYSLQYGIFSSRFLACVASTFFDLCAGGTAGIVHLVRVRRHWRSKQSTITTCFWKFTLFWTSIAMFIGHCGKYGIRTYNSRHLPLQTSQHERYTSRKNTNSGNTIATVAPSRSPMPQFDKGMHNASLS